MQKYSPLPRIVAITVLVMQVGFLSGCASGKREDPSPDTQSRTTTATNPNSTTPEVPNDQLMRNKRQELLAKVTEISTAIDQLPSLTPDKKKELSGKFDTLKNDISNLSSGTADNRIKPSMEPPISQPSSDSGWYHHPLVPASAAFVLSLFLSLFGAYWWNSRTRSSWDNGLEANVGTRLNPLNKQMEQLLTKVQSQQTEINTLKIQFSEAPGIESQKLDWHQNIIGLTSEVVVVMKEIRSELSRICPQLRLPPLNSPKGPSEPEASVSYRVNLTSSFQSQKVADLRQKCNFRLEFNPLFGKFEINASGHFLGWEESSNNSRKFFIIPELEGLNTESEFTQTYSQVFDCENPGRGPVTVIAPAEASPGWELITKGQLRINPVSRG